MKHKDLSEKQIAHSEKNVQACLSAFNSFMDPFNIEERTSLFSISSGAKLPLNIEEDVLKSDQKGKRMKEQFIEERLKQNSNFFDPVKKLNLKTMADTSKTTKVKTSNNKVVELKHQGNIAFQLLVNSQKNNVALHEVMKYQLTPVPYCLGTSDGYLNKTNKAAGVKVLTSGIDDSSLPLDDKTLLVVDGNALFHVMTDVPDNFKGISEKVFSMIPGRGDVIFSTDMYSPQSIKASERKRRGCGQQLLMKGVAMKRPSDWRGFLSNDQNKKQFARILLDVWSEDEFSSHLKDRKVIIQYLIK